MNGKVYCNGTRIKCLQQMELTVGMVGAEVEFDFSEEWDGLGKLAVFRSDGSRDVIVDENGVAVVPHEILATPGMDVEVGVYAVREDGTTWPAPTPFCKLTRNGIAEGADPSGDESYPPTPSVGEQLQNQINSLGERVDKLEVGGGSGSGASEAIVDVSELPTENINEDVLYRLTTGMVVFNGQNGRAFDDTAVYIVDSLPETGEPCSSDIGESTAIYYNTSKGVAYGYIDERASVSLMQPVGWKSASTAFAAMGYEYSGVVTSMNDIARSSAAVLLEHTLYHYKNGWERVAGDTPFFDLSNLGLEAVDLAGVADGVSVRVGADTRAIINSLARGAVKFGFQIIYNGATLDVEALGSAMYLEAENTYQIHNFSVFADMPMTVTISVDELYVSVSVAAAQSGGGSIELDTTLTQSGKAADAKAVGDALANISGGVTVEPAEDDIPKVFFGGALQQTKDEAVVPFRYISKTRDVSGYAEIKAQGNSTMRFPKKNQTVKMYKDAACTEKLKVDFKGWGKQNKHCYKANWTDLSQARNVVSARIWGDIIKSRANYAELPELMRTSPNLGVIDGFPVKVYADGVYQGRYTLNIPKDEWMSNMDKDLDTHCILCGEGGTSALFRGAWTQNELGWTDEIHSTVPDSIMTRWNEVINFVMTSTDEAFKANLDSYIDVQSLLDYHLFGLAMCGMDGYAKNQLFMTWDGIKWYAQVYDMDATWGLSWNAYFVATDYPRSSYEDIGEGGNLLYIRLEEVFWNELRERWAELKAGALSMANIVNRFERFTDIMPEELVKEDYAKTTANGAFTGIPLQGENNVQQIRTYALARQKWVDEYLYRVAATSVTLNQSTLTFTDENPVTLVATVEPSDSTDTVVWTSTDETVAIVDNGVVTPLKNGSCVIRATAGIVSASCEVTVSGIVVQYSVTNTLLGVTSSNASAAVTEGATYTATLTAKDGYTLEGASVTVTMGGVDITATAYSGGVITIANVTGNITIAVAAVDTSVAYSLTETTFDGSNTDGVDTGIKLQDEVKDYTVFVDFTPRWDESAGGEYKVLLNEGAHPWPGWKIEGNSRNEIFGTSFSGDSATTWAWSLLWDNRHKFVLKHSNGVFRFAKEGATAMTTVEDGKIKTDAHTVNLKVAEGVYLGTIHGAKVWLEAKTDEECLAMVNS